MRHWKLIPWLFALAALLDGSARADVAPHGARLVPFDGRLLDEQAHAVAGPVSLEIGFFGSEEGDDRLPAPPVTFPTVPLVDGVFHVTLVLTSDDAAKIYGDGKRTVFLQVKDTTHGRTYRRQPAPPAVEPPPAAPVDPAGPIELPGGASAIPGPMGAAAPASQPPAAAAAAPQGAGSPAVAAAATVTPGAPAVPAAQPPAATPAAASAPTGAPAPASSVADAAAAAAIPAASPTVAQTPAAAPAAAAPTAATSPTPDTGGSTPPQDPVQSAAASACLASPVAGAKFLVPTHDPSTTCAATCAAARPQAACVRGWTLFPGAQTFDFGNECTSAATPPGLAAQGRLCCCLTTTGPAPLLP